MHIYVDAKLLPLSKNVYKIIQRVKQTPTFSQGGLKTQLTIMFFIFQFCTLSVTLQQCDSMQGTTRNQMENL